jgi:hypothetical protein
MTKINGISSTVVLNEAGEIDPAMQGAAIIALAVRNLPREMGKVIEKIGSFVQNLFQSQRYSLLAQSN